MELEKKYEYKFSIVMAIYNVEKYLEEAILSVVNQDIGFEESVQLILVNDGSPDNSNVICEKYKSLYPNNIVYIEKENGGVSSARNEGMKYVQGKYMNFLDSDDKLSENSLRLVYDFFEETYNYINIVSIPIHFFEGKAGGHTLNYKYKTTRQVDLLREHDFVQLSSSSCFFKEGIRHKFKFNESMKYAEDGELINKILLKTYTIGAVRQARYWYRSRENASSATQIGISDKRWYNEYLKKFSLELINYSIKNVGYVPRFIQYTIMYDLQWRFQIERVNEEILSNNEFNEFISQLKEILTYIDNDIILKQKNISVSHKIYILTLKKNSNSECLKKIYTSNNIELLLNETYITSAKEEILKVDLIDINNYKLTIEGYISNNIPNEDYEVKVEINDKMYSTNYMDRSIYDKLSLGKIISKQKGFRFETIIDNRIKIQNIKIYIIRNEIKICPNIILGKFVRINRKLDNSYFATNTHRVMFKYNSFILLKNSMKVNVGREYRLEKELLKKRQPQIVFIRLMYFILKTITIKPIWLLMDRIDKADDNAEALFRYLQKEDKKAKKYFVINKDSSDYKRLKKYGKVVGFNSYYHKLLILLSEKVISSHIEDNIRVPFGGNGSALKDLVNFKFVFLQHGITKDDVSGWLNKYNKNINLFVTAVKQEYESIISGNYFYDENVVKLTGFPRYDNLKNTPIKQILIMPTWRNNIVNKINQENGERPYSTNFKKSEYFKVYNNLINNAVILDIAKKYGYTIKFFPHPAIQQQIGDFQRNDQVIFAKYNESYQKLFNESSLLITDYSSVAFDFAYMKKPVIYYQFDRNTFFKGHTYEEGYFDYETMGMGPVISNENELVKCILECIENDCIMSEEYRARVESFYKYTDKNNCKRVYEEIRKV